LISIIHLNAIGKNQIACLVLSFYAYLISYVAVYVEIEQVEVPFTTLSVGFSSIFLIKNRYWRITSFVCAFVTFSILHYIQLTQREFGIVGFVLTLAVLFIFSKGLQFVNAMRNRDEKTILSQNEIIKANAEQLLLLEKEKHKNELLLKQKDIEMVLTNSQVQQQLNDNIIRKLKLAKEGDTLEKSINQVILELKQQNEINARMKLIKQNLDQVNTSFFESLEKAHPKITRVDKEFCSYINIGLSTKEIAIIRSTTVNTVNVAKTRLRKKLSLKQNSDIASYLKSL